MMTKKELRQMIRQRKQQHPVGESSAFISRLKDNKHFTHAQTLLLYSALSDEVPTQILIDGLAAQGKTVLLPRVVSDTDMELRRYSGPADLQRGAFGIFEPTGELFTDYNTIDVAIIPGMAFDAKGHRLGRGKGYYDRLLPRLKNAYKIGVCFPFQYFDEIPSEAHDVRMDCVMWR